MAKIPKGVKLKKLTVKGDRLGFKGRGGHGIGMKHGAKKRRKKK